MTPLVLWLNKQSNGAEIHLKVFEHLRGALLNWVSINEIEENDEMCSKSPVSTGLLDKAGDISRSPYHNYESLKVLTLK